MQSWAILKALITWSQYSCRSGEDQSCTLTVIGPSGQEAITSVVSVGLTSSGVEMSSGSTVEVGFGNKVVAGVFTTSWVGSSGVWVETPPQAARSMLMTNISFLVFNVVNCVWFIIPSTWNHLMRHRSGTLSIVRATDIFENPRCYLQNRKSKIIGSSWWL